jgi:hypothetical protein
MPVELGIFNTSGIEVERIVDSRQDVGPHTVHFSPGNLPSGTYLYRLLTPVGSVTKQMVIVK